MSNYAYLCCTDIERIYPSFENPQFDPHAHTVACDVEAVPLLWIALFRPPDMRSEQFMADGRLIEAHAPLAEKQQALGQLSAAVPILNRLFPGWGTLDDHGEFLGEAICDAPGAFVTIEWEEVALLYGEDDFYRDLDTLLVFLSSPGANEARAKKLFMEIACLDKAGKFPPADSLLRDSELTEAEEWNLVRLLGASHYRPVPWEA